MPKETKREDFSDKVFPYQYTLLNYINDIDDAKKLRSEDFYDYQPFDKSRDHQYSGNVIQYLLLTLSEVNTSVNHGGYTRAQWLEYKKSVFEKICSWVARENREKKTDFKAKDCATSLHRIAKMLTEDLSKSNIS